MPGGLSNRVQSGIEPHHNSTVVYVWRQFRLADESLSKGQPALVEFFKLGSFARNAPAPRIAAGETMKDERKLFKKKRWHRDYFDALSKFGTITAASEVAGVSRMSIYREMTFPEFAEMSTDAYRRHRDLLLLKVTNIAMKEGAASTPTSLQALQYLIARADKQLLDADRASGEVPQGEGESMTIQVSEGMAKRLWPMMRELHRTDQFEDESGADDDKKKPN